MTREPPSNVRKILRKEVNFACPICGKPNLEWHHFDPPWHEFNHHNPEGMIALCVECHRMADVGTFTDNQLKKYKSLGKLNEVKGLFSWRRSKLLVVLGGNFFYETMILFEFFGKPVLWLHRDPEGYLLLNVDMLSVSGEERVKIEDNSWVSKGNPIDFECLPSGKSIRARYLNGDYINIEFITMNSKEQLKKRYKFSKHLSFAGMEKHFPLVILEVQMTVAKSKIRFGPSFTSINNFNMKGVLMIQAPTAYKLSYRSDSSTELNLGGMFLCKPKCILLNKYSTAPYGAPIALYGAFSYIIPQFFLQFPSGQSACFILCGN